MEELKRNLKEITKKSAGKDTPSEVQRGVEKTATTSDQRKRKPTQSPSKDDGKKRRLSTDRSPPDANKPLSEDEDLLGEEDDKTSKGKRSHHKKKACSVAGCKFFGSDLKRHLKLHVRKGEIAEDSIKQLATIMTTGKKQRGKSEMQYKSGKRKPGRFKKWCPVQNCSSIVLNVGRHLVNCHGIKKNTTQYKNLVQDVKHYTGIKEISMFLQKPEQSAEEAMAASDDDSDNEMAIRELAEGCGRADDIYPTVYSDNESEEGVRVRVSEERVQVESQSGQDEGKSEHEDESDDQSDSSFEPVASNLTAEQFFKATTPENPRHRWLTGFYDYLSRPAMGDKKKSVRLQHAGQMRILLEYLDPKGDDISCLAQDEGDAVWKRWVKPTLNSGSKKAGTVISYLTTFEKFLSFVTNARYNRSGPPLHPSYIDTFRQVLPEIKGWRSTVDRQTQAEQNQRFMDESDALITPAEKAELKTTEPYVEGLKVLNKADQGKVLSFQEYVDARDLLITIFSIDNATRPGPLNNATLKDYETARTEQGNRIMLVARHKRSREGPAILGMTPELQRLMEIYVKKIRPQFAPPFETHLFLTKEGKPFPEGTIGRRTRTFFAKTKLRIGEKLASVSVRKFVSTKAK